MTQGHLNVETIVPAWHRPTGFPHDNDDGVALDSLPAGTRLVVDTRNTRYHVTVLDGTEHEVLIEGGAHLPTATRVYLEGSYNGDSVARNGWIEPNRRMLFINDARRIITSPVASVAIEPSDESSETDL